MNATKIQTDPVRRESQNIQLLLILVDLMSIRSELNFSDGWNLEFFASSCCISTRTWQPQSSQSKIWQSLQSMGTCGYNFSWFFFIFPLRKMNRHWIRTTQFATIYSWYFCFVWHELKHGQGNGTLPLSMVKRKNLIVRILALSPFLGYFYLIISKESAILWETEFDTLVVSDLFKEAY